MKKITLFGFMTVFAAGIGFGEVTVLYKGVPQQWKLFETAVPKTVFSKGDLADREVSLWMQTTATNMTGWTWAFPTKPEDCHLTDGTVKSPLLNVEHPEWGDSGPRAPGNKCEMKFALLPGMKLDQLKLVLSRPPYHWGGGAVTGPITVEVWKGIRATPSVFVDNANRCAIVDISSVPAESYRYTYPDGRVVTTRLPFCRRRFPENPEPYTVKIEAKTRKDGIVKAEARVVPHEKTLQAPLPVEKVLVGQCVYDVHEQFRDEIITNNLASLLVGWPKATDYTNMPPHIERTMTENDIHFMTIYGGAGRDVTEHLQKRWGSRYLWNNIGELSGYLYQGIGSAKACNVPQDARDLTEARNWYINSFIRRTTENEHNRCDFFFSTSGSPLAAYELQGGIDFMCCELYAIGAGNLAYATGEMRGAARKWKPEYWGGWLAEEWQTCNIPYTVPQKFNLLKAGLYQQYLMGTSIIVLESGAQSTQAEKYTSGANNIKELYDGKTPKAYRDTVKEFYDWVRANPRDKGTPETDIALVLGNNDGFVGMSHPSFAIWAQHKQAETNQLWRYGAPEYTWGLAQDVFFPRRQEVIAPYPNVSLAGSPYGQIDLVSADDEVRLSDLTRYKLLAYAGWNTMTPHIKKVLAAWVRQGGELIIGIPHFLKTADRDYKDFDVKDLVSGGDLRPLMNRKIVAKVGAAARVVPANGKGETWEDGGVHMERLGKGRVWLMTNWLFPAADKATGEAYQKFLRERAAALKQSVMMTGEDAAFISYGVYPKTIYALNLDTLNSRTVKLNGRTYTFKPCEMKVIKR